MKQTLVICYMMFVISGLFSQNIEMAKALNQHGLKDKALEEFIKIYFNNSSIVAVKAEALYYMGDISFKSSNIDIALLDWDELVKKYPDTEFAKMAQENILQINGALNKLSHKNNLSVIASVYFNNAKFWDDSPEQYTIEERGILSLDMALYWYDRIIKEFPNSVSSELAQEKKIKCLISGISTGSGRELITRYKDYRYFDLDIPKVIEAYNKLEAEFPNNSNLNSIRYQISQAYNLKEDYDNTLTWLNIILSKNNNEENFYTKLARERVAYIEKVKTTDKKRK